MYQERNFAVCNLKLSLVVLTPTTSTPIQSSSDGNHMTPLSSFAMEYIGEQIEYFHNSVTSMILILLAIINFGRYSTCYVNSFVI